MKVSEIKVTDIADYIRLEEGEYKPEHIQLLIDTAILFISGYTGIPKPPTEIPTEPLPEPPIKTLDNYNDFVIVVYVLCHDMHDNRTLYVDKNNLNKLVENILGMHSINLL